MNASGFDRIKPPSERTVGRKDDHQGKRSLYSEAEQPPSTGSAAIECQRCGRRSVVSVFKLARLSFPGIHVPASGRGHKAWLKCPSCSQRSWVRVIVG